MESNNKSIDKQKEVLMEVPSFVHVNNVTPIKLSSITIEPLNPLTPDPAMLLPEDILVRLGVTTNKKTSLLDSLFACNSCAACKAVSKETLNEIRPEDLTEAN